MIYNRKIFDKYFKDEDLTARMKSKILNYANTHFKDMMNGRSSTTMEANFKVVLPEESSDKDILKTTIKQRQMTINELFAEKFPAYPNTTILQNHIKDFAEAWLHTWLEDFKNKPGKDILTHGKEILYDRSEEKERQYGPMQKCIDHTAEIATSMGDKDITSIDVYNVLIALKLAREVHAHKEDNMLDAVVYMAAKNDYLNKILEK